MGAWLSTMFSQSTGSPLKWVELPANRLGGTFASLILQNIKGHDDWHTLKAPAFYGPENEWEAVSQESPQTSDELRIISINSRNIESEVKDCSVLTEFGPGDGNKTMEMLKLAKKLNIYRMVDTDRDAIAKLGARITKLYPHLHIQCWRGSFESAPSYATENHLHLGHVLSLGSTLFNNSPEVNNKILRDLAHITDKIIIGQDGNTDDSIRSSYTTPAFDKFINKGCGELDNMLNSIDHNTDRAILQNEGWQSEVCIVHGPASHVALQLVATKVMEFIFNEDTAEEEKVLIEKNTRFNIFKAYKYSQQSIESMAAEASYVRSATYSAPNTESHMMASLTIVEDLRKLDIEIVHMARNIVTVI
ncbi:hypothetical protein M441DRAFT_454473 [Trichoderma asperellum CBS 433.97]|uniref:Histidine-specific methyltransferase SAM-dependent domain-containing protein n=1 Tax=Trichoderma asperellum (strain ATCC 204424 / CBS 433.97 / NBRC 101777) TaxID=1042311 RepID=A0A2T3YQS4_TRIA4|nr:hypothetical protein M441DRAFT_454473 [Trichoderma asperellum CBS 433.97]PTB34923.1 hypothetical protein M441DRAFT_454473 [Trichoderma asperellum CBS 433.97]